MVKKKLEQIIEKRENMRSGSGEVMITHYFKKDEINAACRLCAQLKISPGVSIGLHEHINEDEIFIIQQGSGLIIDGNKEVAIEAGDAILTGKGDSHSIKNTGSEDLLVTAIIMQYN